jgi:hypothetical protein
MLHHFLMRLNVQVSRLVRQKIDRYGSCFCAQRLKIPDGACPSKSKNLLRFGSEIHSGYRDTHLKLEHLYIPAMPAILCRGNPYLSQLA